MFFKEVISIFGLGSGIFVTSGFALKVNKFENNQILYDSQTKSFKLYLTIDSFQKLSLKEGENFNYTVNNQNKIKKITNIENRDNHIELTLNYSHNPGPEPRSESIKYYLESKSFWINLLS